MATINYTPNSESVSSKQTWEIPYAGGGGGCGANTAPENYYNCSGVWEPYEVTTHTTGEGGSTGKDPAVIIPVLGDDGERATFQMDIEMSKDSMKKTLLGDLSDG